MNTLTPGLRPCIISIALVVMLLVQSVTICADPVDSVNSLTESSAFSPITNVTTTTGSIIALSGELQYGPILFDQTESHILVITNSGDAPLTINSIVYPEGYSGDWSSGTIGAGSSRNVNVTLTPFLTQTTYNGAITVYSDAASGASQITVQGNVVPVFVKHIVLSGDMQFGYILINETETRSLVIQNIGNVPMTVNSINYPAGYSGDWDGGSIAAGASQAVTVTFNPTVAKSYSGTITVNSDAGYGTNTIACTGMGITMLTRILKLSGILSFGYVEVNHPLTRKMTLRNTGTDTLTIDSITYPSGFSGDWSSGPIAANTYQDIMVTFSPTLVQNYGGTITISSDKTEGPDTINCNGTGIPEQTRIIEVSGDLNWGSIPIQESISHSITISNTGNSPLQVSSISFPTGFTGNWHNGTIAAGSIQSVEVTFSPSLIQDYTGAIIIASNSTSGTNTITATAVGIPRLIGLSGNLDFGDIYINNTTTSTLTISNNGDSPLAITSITWPTGFSGNWAGGTIAAGESEEVVVTFSPTEIQGYGGSVVVSAGEEPLPASSSIPCSGNGISPDTRIIALSGDLLFTTRLREPVTALMTISNSGNSPLTINSIKFPDAFSGNWSSGSIPAGGSQEVVVTFNPPQYGPYGGTIVVHSDSTSGSNYIEARAGITQINSIELSGDLDFGSVPVNGSATKTFTINNTGTGIFTLNSISFPTGFSGTWDGMHLFSGNVLTVTVTFNPTASKKYGGNIFVSTSPSPSEGSQTIAVSGVGGNPDIRSMELSGSLSFAGTGINTTATKPFTITNTGTSTITISSITVPEAFAINWDGGTITAGQSQEVTVTFTPWNVKDYEGLVTVNSDATVEENLPLPPLSVANSIAYAQYGTPQAIDGIIDPAWSQSMVYPVDVPIQVDGLTDPTSAADLSGKFQALWDDDALYLFVTVLDDLHYPSRGSFVGLFCSAAYSRNFGEWGAPGYDGLSDSYLVLASDADTATHSLYSYLRGNVDDRIIFQRETTSSGYSLEIALPWAVLLGYPEAGNYFMNGVFSGGPDTAEVGTDRDFMGFELQISDDDDFDDTRDHAVGWYVGPPERHGDYAWVDTSVWGTLQLVKPSNSLHCSGSGMEVSPEFYNGAHTYDLGGGWKWNQLFGFIYVEYYPFAYITGGDQWLYLVGQNESAGYFFFSFLRGHWCYTSDDYYESSWYYDFDTDEWLQDVSVK